MRASDIWGKYAPLATGRNQFGMVSFFMKRHYRSLGLKAGAQAFVKAALEYRFSLHQAIPSVRFLAVETGYSYRHVLRIVDRLEALGYVRVTRRLGHPTHLDFTPLLDLFLELLKEEQELAALEPPQRTRRHDRVEAAPPAPPPPPKPSRRREEEDVFVWAASHPEEAELVALEASFGEALVGVSQAVEQVKASIHEAGWTEEEWPEELRRAGVVAKAKAKTRRWGLFFRQLEHQAKDAHIHKAVAAENQRLAELEAELNDKFNRLYWSQETYNYEEAMRVNEQLIALRDSREERLRKAVQGG